MALRLLVPALIMGAAISPASATQPDDTPMTTAPAASPAARYCLRVMPRTGSLIERVQCWTRQDWQDQGVDLDKEWAEEGVAIIDENGTRILRS